MHLLAADVAWCFPGKMVKLKGLSSEDWAVRAANCQLLPFL